MKINKFLIATLLLATSLASCKNDKEEDIKLTDSSVKGLFINEVFTSNPDWIELYNSSDKEIDLSGFILQDDKGAEEEYKIPQGTKIAAKGFIVFNEASKKGSKPGFSFGLSSKKGDIVKLFDANSKLIDEVAVPVIENKESYGRVTDGAKEWKKFEKPTEGISNSSTVELIEEPKSPIIGLFINEVFTSNPDWIELYNSSDKEIDLSGFILQDDKGAEEEYKIPQGTKIAAKGFIVFNEASKKGSKPGFSFGLSSSKGDIVKLFDKDNKLVDETIIPIIENKESYGRVTDGAKEWKKFEKPTEGTSNSATVEEPSSTLKLYINEIMSAPDENSEIKNDFIELYNGEDNEINIGGFLLHDDGGVDKGFTIPENTIIPSKGFIVYSEVKKKSKEVGFKFGLSAKGDKVTLLNKEGELIDEKATPNFGKTKGQSYARKGDGGSEWAIVDTPTPGKTNGSAK